MIKITVELWPLGSEKHKKEIASMKIWNDGTGTKSMGNYKYQSNLSRTWKSGSIEKFPRQRLNVWDLIFRVLYNAVGERNNAPMPKIEE